MLSRIVAVMLGLIACVAISVFLNGHWTVLEVSGLTLSNLLASINADPIDLKAALRDPPTRWSWTLCLPVAAFAAVTSIALMIGGLIETLKVRRRLRALRYDSVMAGSWNAADWRAVFTGAAIEDRAEAIVAAILPMQNGANRRIVADTPLLATLDRIWIDRLTLAGTITPLPLLLLGLTATLALLRLGSPGEWEMTLAAGTACAFLIQAIHYLVRMALSLSVAMSVKAATAAMRPLISVEAIEPSIPLAGATPAQTVDAEAIALTLASVLSGPMARLAEAADRLSSMAQNREQTIDAAMAEVRAGIERLLATAYPD